uniref:Uncharacterized protein n=1 Tax=Rhizophora mucronata TaxID=61149 RepID=A0A2P2PT67_RHIMU
MEICQCLCVVSISGCLTSNLSILLLLQHCFPSYLSQK